MCNIKCYTETTINFLLPSVGSPSFSFCPFLFPFFLPFLSFFLLSVMLSEESKSSQDKNRRKKKQVVLLGTCGKWALPDQTLSLLERLSSYIDSHQSSTAWNHLLTAGQREREGEEGRERESKGGSREKNRERKVEKHCSRN